MILKESNPQIINGEVFEDERGKIHSLNSFRFDDVKRSYFIHHPDRDVIRGWHGHQFEKKWFWCLRGDFVVALIKIDDWQRPDPDLIPQIFKLNVDKSEILYVPEGYANCVKASIDDALLMVYSGKLLSEAINDSWRYDKNLWIDWSKY